MKLFKMFKRGQRGFTLVELMVVMAIMAMLATIVVPAVTGTKGPSENTQIMGDINAVQSAAAKYNNDSTVARSWPETSANVTGLSFFLSNGTTSTTVTAGDAAGNYKAVSWTATTTIRNAAGALVTVGFVPDFVPKNPDSVRLTTAGSKPVYLWLMQIGAATDAPTRTLEVYKTADGTDYSKVN